MSAPYTIDPIPYEAITDILQTAINVMNALLPSLIPLVGMVLGVYLVKIILYILAAPNRWDEEERIIEEMRLPDNPEYMADIAAAEERQNQKNLIQAEMRWKSYMTEGFNIWQDDEEED